MTLTLAGVIVGLTILIRRRRRGLNRAREMEQTELKTVVAPRPRQRKTADQLAREEAEIMLNTSNLPLMEEETMV